MSIRLIALDLDGTLLDSSKNMPEEFVPWVQEHNNIRIVIASGRQYYTILRDFPKGREHLTIIAENGGIAFDEKGEKIYSTPIDSKIVKICLDRIFAVEGAVPVLCGENCAYIPTVDEGVYLQTGVYYARIKMVDDIYECIKEDNILKIAIFFDDARAGEHIEKLQNLEGNVVAVLSGEKWVDIAGANINKGFAIECILKKYSIDRKDAMAFGDYLNDREMLEACEESYCMANGHQELKSIAKYIAPSNDENGVMQILRKLK